MKFKRFGLPRLVIVLVTFVAATASTLHARADAPRDKGNQDPQTTAASQPGVVLLDKYASFFQKAAETGTAGYDVIQPAFSELMQMARQSLADRRIDQQFFDRYSRVLRVTLLASIPDKAEILKPITNREFSSFIRDVLGKNIDESSSILLGDLSSALANEVTNLRRLVASDISALSAAPTAPVRVGGDIKQPERTKYVLPEYPVVAKRAKVQGTVIIEATIGKDGHVIAAKILKPAPLLDEAALAAVKQWEYAPTLLGGVPVEVVMVVTVSFNLK